MAPTTIRATAPAPTTAAVATGENSEQLIPDQPGSQSHFSCLQEPWPEQSSGQGSGVYGTSVGSQESTWEDSGQTVMLLQT